MNPITKKSTRLWFISGACLIVAILAGVYINTRKPVSVNSNFGEKIPEKSEEKKFEEVKSEEIKSSPEQKTKISGNENSDPRSGVAQKEVLGLISGQIKGKSVASADIFSKGGFATDIDAILSGVGGLKGGGSGGVGRKGVAGIGYGGYGSGFGGSTGALNAEYLTMKKRTLGRSFESDNNFNTENYDLINENGFLNVNSNPLSTFSIDVDVASYSNIRRFINNGRLPPKDAVRIEEMINYFRYDYEQPRDDDPFSITVEMAPCPWNEKNRLALIGLQGKDIEKSKIPPCNIVFLIDVSGSMQAQNKLPLVKQSIRLLMQELRGIDLVSIVVYAGAAGLVLPPTSGDKKEQIIDCIDRLEAGGSTAGGEGILLAYQTAQSSFLQQGNNRVILATDGDFNVGVSSDAELVRMIEEKRKSGIFLTVLGFGTGNYKDAKMEKLADKGNGNYAYIDNLSEARKVLIEQMSGTLLTIAKDVKIQVEFNPSHVQSYRLIGYENRIMKREDFNNDKKDAGELGAGHNVTALYELVPAEKDDIVEEDSLRYQEIIMKSPAAESDEIMLVKLRYKAPDSDTSKLIYFQAYNRENGVSNNLKFASAVASFGMLLRESEYKGNITPDKILQSGEETKGRDPFGYRAEFLSLVRKYKNLSKS